MIGNTDRHQDNWGYVFPRAAGDKASVLAPCYDNGTSLGHERYPERVAGWSTEDFRRYVAKGRHHIKWRLEDANGCGHMEMITLLVQNYPALRDTLRAMLDKFNLDRLEQLLRQSQSYRLPVPLAPERSTFMLTLIELRLKLLLERFL